MKYAGMPWGMWILYRKSFQTHLVSDLGFTENEAAAVTKTAKPKYKEIIGKLPEFEKADRFKMNIENCALLAERPNLSGNIRLLPAVRTVTADTRRKRAFDYERKRSAF